LPSTDASDRESRLALPAEARLLFLTAGGSGADAEFQSLLAPDLDWEVVGWLAEKEKALLALSRRLAAVGAERLPLDIRVLLQRRGMVAEFMQLQLKQRLDNVIVALGRAGIEVMLLKGAAMVQTTYGSFEHRPMTDLDLLVHPDAVHEARRLLNAEGWVLPARYDTPACEDFYNGHYHLAPLQEAQGAGIRVELHTDLFVPGHPFRLTPADLWGEARSTEVAGQRVYVPATMHQLLHLCLHFAWSHMMRSGAWRTTRDIEALVASGGVDWDTFVRVARDSNATTAAFWTLRLVRVLADVAVPPDVIAALRPPTPTWIVDRLERHFLAGLLPPTANCPSVRLGHLLWEAGVRPRWSRHGPVRPWSRQVEAQAAFRPEEAMTEASKLKSHVRNRAAWRSYLQIVLQ
jgi:hypothetical protein